jgi:cellulose synthase/poly-beta-1,6-N-acetylglucosamine synthase-like glycosyltransferase
MIYTVLRAAFFAVFTGLHAALMLGLFLEWRRDKKAGGNGEAFVSVVVPFRNEADRMTVLLADLEAQDYPGREFIFIDDRSTDGTREQLETFAGRVDKVQIIILTENPGFNHKQYALEKGLQAAKGEFILFTDADCELKPGWIRAMVRRMGNIRTGAAIGPVFKKPLNAVLPAAGSFFSLYQCFDHAVRYMYLVASTGLGAAGGGFGNNLILRNDALRAIGGYATVPPSPTEDAALVSRIRSITGYRIRSFCGGDTAVFTAPEKNWKAFAAQTLRWNNGGLFSPDITTRCNFSFLMITISMGMLALPALPFLPGLWPLPAAVFFSMAVNTAATLALFGSSLPKAGPAYALQTVFTPVYFTFLTILGLLGFKPSWKSSGEQGRGT